MSNVKTSAVSGCIIWFLLITVISGCIMPFAFIMGGVTSASEWSINTMGGFICPENTTPTSYSYDTFTTDEYGVARPSTAYELHCVDASGKVVKEDPIVYAFGWIGLWAVIGMIVSAVLTFIFAVPGGMLVTKVLNSLKVKKTVQN